VNHGERDAQRGLMSALVGDGRPLLALVAVCLMLSGGFALFLSATGQFLPHDEAFLGMGKEELCGINQCRIVHFMFHDRVSFGGALIAIAWLYLWLIQFPLRDGEPWAWWVFLVTGITGFGSFLAYLGYGYLDTWHGVATLFLLPLHLGGLIASWRSLPCRGRISDLFRCAAPIDWQSRLGLGRALWLGTAAGLCLAGITITFLGMTAVFVPQDLHYIGMTAEELHSINPRLVPLIAHDRAGFGGAIGTCGLILGFCVWCGRPSPALWQAVVLACGTGFLTAIGVHPAIGYNDFVHLAPAYAGAMMFLVGALVSYRPMIHGNLVLPAGLPPASPAFDTPRSDD
jgi:hypothetical protein